MKYFFVTHKDTGEEFRAESPSKNKLKKKLPRFCTDRGEYRSLWAILEVSGISYFNKRHLPQAPNVKEYP